MISLAHDLVRDMDGHHAAAARQQLGEGERREEDMTEDTKTRRRKHKTQKRTRTAPQEADHHEQIYFMK
jgi:hypothetical protein